MTYTSAATSGLRPALDAILEGSAPLPSRERFQPLRIGLLGIWQYDEQEFTFHDGRMILRGRNGSGKTKVLEVTSPFLFDANLTARRLDPFGSAARSMRDNLLYGNRKHHIGYVWCEYGRLRPDGTTEYRTLGAGMRAQAARTGAPDSWYFLTEQRIGVDFTLYRAGRQPKNDKDLSEELGTGAVFGTADGYRSAVGRELFGLNPDRFRALVELLITLRRPKLSENFNVSRLTTMLRDGLPPIDESMVDDLARGFDALAREQDELQTLITTAHEVSRFLDQYRVYARKMVRHCAGRVRSGVTKYDDVTRAERGADQALTESRHRVESLRRRAKELETAQVEQAARIRSLEQRPEIEQQGVLLALEQQASTAEQHAAEAAHRLADATQEYDTVERELRQVYAELDAEQRDVDLAQADAVERSESCSLRLEHEVQAERFRTDPSSARTVLESVVNARRSAARHARHLLRGRDNAQTEFARAEGARDDFATRRDAAGEEVARRQGVLTAEIEAVSTAVISWSGDCREVHWDDERVERLLLAVQRAGDVGGTDLSLLVREHFSAAESTLLAARARIDSDRQGVETALAERDAERERVAAEHDPPPPAPLVQRRDRSREQLPGAPLWRVLEFADDTTDEVRARLEAALLGAGLLDAWVTPDGTLLSAETLDVVALPGRARTTGIDLRAALRPVEDSAVPSGVVTRLLESIAFVQNCRSDLDGPWISADGGWAIGPLRGRTHASEASHIGAAARERARLRRLAALDHEIAELRRSVHELADRRGELDLRLERLAAELVGCPADQPVREARTLLDVALRTAAELAAEVERAEQRLNARRSELHAAHEALHSYANEHSLPTSSTELDRLDAALTEYWSSVRELILREAQLHSVLRRLAAVRERVQRQHVRRDQALADDDRARSAAIALRAEYTARHELVGADVDRVLAELNEAKSRAALLREESAEVTAEQHRAAEQFGAARKDLESVQDQRAQREGERSAAVAAFEKLREHGFLELAQLFGAAPPAEPNMTRSIADARRAEEALHGENAEEKARNNSRNNIDERFRDLQRQIEGADWRPWGDNDGELFVVKVTHNGIDRSIPELHEIVEREIETRKGYLDEQERRLFAEVLLGRIGEHLRQRRVEAKSLTDRMNRLLEQRQTASGMKMRLVWEADPEAGPEVQRAVSLLDRQAAQFLSDEARDELVGFLGARVRQARDDDLVGDWKVHLHQALDYRYWSRFRLQVKHGTADWSELTDAKHQQGSGGEKAVMLQLPLFVAAAAHYEAAASSAPRPVYLDEAFAGIDAEMRGSCMELLTQLDLDFVMASHDEWGFHSEVPGLVTYSLYRDPEVPGVLTTPFVWDGRVSHELVDPALRDGGTEPGSDGDDLFAS